MPFDYVTGKTLYRYVFKRPEPLSAGPMSDRDKYFVYAHSQAEAFAKFNDAMKIMVDNKIIEEAVVPQLIGREPW